MAHTHPCKAEAALVKVSVDDVKIYGEKCMRIGFEAGTERYWREWLSPDSMSTFDPRRGPLAWAQQARFGPRDIWMVKEWSDLVGEVTHEGGLSVQDACAKAIAITMRAVGHFGERGSKCGWCERIPRHFNPYSEDMDSVVVRPTAIEVDSSILRQRHDECLFSAYEIAMILEWNPAFLSTDSVGPFDWAVSNRSAAATECGS
jgi:hypothetical protein